ncbi:hypothetical protein E3T37_00695 [Cryobacterium sp. TMT2-10]|uniref:hypothetical protein n=1 Tax=Cryobacterium sp. TMT2-10 TaxID=1259244 RepID=UPI00106CF71A|nr:hypothetical protein [Cryobacterium sp. TMT2-10]TFD43817.1 hypothetical protein E3T37_00695 [Cryobacterium sp. TMT2-10]
MDPFDYFKPPAAQPARTRDVRLVPARLTMNLLEQGMTRAGLFWSRPTIDSIVTFWDETPSGPGLVMAIGPDAEMPRPILWSCSRDTLLCRADEDLITFTHNTRRRIQAITNDWNATEAWPCAALTFEETLRASIRVPLFSGTNLLELSVLCTLMSRSIGDFYTAAMTQE